MSKRRYFSITLGDQPFTLDKKIVVNLENRIISRQNVRDCYGRCSDRKKAIYDWWENWFYENGGYCGVSQYNTNFFSLEGIVKQDCKTYYCHITPSHNYCWETF